MNSLRSLFYSSFFNNGERTQQQPNLNRPTKRVEREEEEEEVSQASSSFFLYKPASDINSPTTRQKERKEEGKKRGIIIIYSIHTHVRYWGRAAQQMVNAHSHCHCHCHAARRVERWVSASSMSSSCSSRCFFQGKKKSVIECSAGQCSCNCFLNAHGTAVIM